MTIYRCIAFALLAFFAFHGSLVAQEYPLWGNLKPGPYAVGFQSLSKYDPSRPYKRKYDYEGKLQPGNRARPMQISIWYPATKTTNANHMTFQEYLYLTAQEEKFGELTEQQKQESVNGFLHSRFTQGVAEDKMQQLLKMNTAAIRNAPPDKGKHPLVIGMLSLSVSSPFANSVLYEYLASHGYVVASSPSMGSGGRQLSFDPMGIVTQLQDMQFVIATVHDMPVVDTDKLAVVGFSFGGMSGSTLAMHNTDVDAVVSLDGAMGNRFGYSMMFQSPVYVPANLTVPLLHITAQEANPDADNSFFKSAKYSEVQTVKIKGMRAIDYSTLGMVSSVVPNFGGPAAEGDPKMAYETVCAYALNFLNAKVKKDASAAAFLKKKPDENGIPAGFAVSELRAALKTPPTQEQFVQIIQQKGIPEGRKIFEEVRNNDPDFTIFQAEALNALAEQWIKEKKTAEAIELMKLNVDANDDFWLVYDVLGRAYMEHGDKQMAIDNFNKSLELNPENANAIEMLKKLK